MLRVRSKYTPGAYVRVDPKRRFGKPDSEGGIAYVKGIVGSPNTPQSVRVQYVISKRTSPAVTPQRVHPTIIATTGRKRQYDTTIKPSLIANRLQPNKKRRTVIAPRRTAASATPSTRPGKTMDTAALVSAAKEYNPNHPNGSRAIEYLVKKKNTALAGWLRDLHKHNMAVLTNPKQASGTGNLTANERQLVFTLCAALDVNRDGVFPAIAHAWGVSPKTVKRILARPLVDGSFSFERKKRKDAGLTLLNSTDKCKKVYKPEAVFRKEQRANAPASERLSNEELKAAWDAMSNDEKKHYKDEAAEWLQRAPHLSSAIAETLHRTRGSIPWSRLSAEVAGDRTPLVSTETIRNYTMGMPGSKYVKTCMHPKVDESCKQRRYTWAEAFHAFWDAAEECETDVLVLLAHMDEKWFNGLPTRTNVKSVPGMDVEPVQHSVHHKNHIPKNMFLCSTGFLPHRNNMTRGGRAFKISFERAGRMVAAIRDTFRRVYLPNGTYHYPPDPENRLREMGQLYFQPLEITGSREGTARKPKYSLLKYFLEIEIPALERVVEEIERETGKKVVVRYQMDGAGPHRDATLLLHLNAEFDRRGWMLKFQPANSPLTNVKDACVFPSLSKRVTTLQGLQKKSLVLEGEELCRLATAAWNNLELDTIARSYSFHHQIVNAIAQCKGGDDFVREKSALHCGIRHMFVPYYKDGDSLSSAPCGIQLAADVDEESGEANPDKLKYPKPDTSDLGERYHELLSYQELNFLEKYLPRESERLVLVRRALLLNEWGDAADDEPPRAVHQPEGGASAG